MNSSGVPRWDFSGLLQDNVNERADSEDLLAANRDGLEHHSGLAVGLCDDFGRPLRIRPQRAFPSMPFAALRVEQDQSSSSSTFSSSRTSSASQSHRHEFMTALSAIGPLDNHMGISLNHLRLSKSEPTDDQMHERLANRNSTDICFFWNDGPRYPNATGDQTNEASLANIQHGVPPDSSRALYIDDSNNDGQGTKVTSKLSSYVNEVTQSRLIDSTVDDDSTQIQDGNSMPSTDTSRNSSERPELLPGACPYHTKGCKYDGVKKKIKPSSLRNHYSICTGKNGPSSKEDQKKAKCWICYECGETFSLPKDRKRHYSIKHSNGVRWPCAKCKTEFNRKDNWTRHFRQVHGQALVIEK